MLLPSSCGHDRPIVCLSHVRFHFTREAVERGEIKIEYVNTSAQLADYLTKALPKDAFLKCRGELQE